jgi:hypothetical protein
VISILKAPLWRGFFSLCLLASGVGIAKGVDSTHTLDSVVDEPAVVDPRYVVRIESVGTGAERRSHDVDTLDVSLQGFGKGIGGFDIKIGIDNPELHILEVLPGELIDSCHWELFTPRKTTNLPTTQLLLEVWQVIGLSQTIPDSAGPKCLGFDREVSLMRLVVQNGPRDIGETLNWLDKNHVLHVFFYWEDCTDNTISTESGDTLCVSLRVFDDWSREISDKRPLFPSRTGVPRQCISSQNQNKPQKLVDFYNGVIVLPTPHPPPPIHVPAKMVAPDSSQDHADTTNSPK